MIELAAIKTVEWALSTPNGERCCVYYAFAWGGPDDYWHSDTCPIPALGAAILKEHHWYERSWRDPYTSADYGECYLLITPRALCRRTRGHDSGIHEPRPDELPSEATPVLP